MTKISNLINIFIIVLNIYRLLLKETQTWIEIYNNYKTKMPLYYMHSKTFHPLFKSIIDKTDLIQKKLGLKNENNFIDIFGDYIFDKTNIYEYKQILKILTYGDIVFQETKFEDVKFIPFSLILDEEKNYQNVVYVKNALEQENKYFEEQIDTLKEILDKTTDLCETKGFLNKEVLEKLNCYIKNNINKIIKDLPEYFNEKKELYDKQNLNEADI